MNQLTFNELNDGVTRLQDGDDQAREQLIQLSYDRLHRLAKKMLKQYPTVRRWEETDDVFQRAAMRLWQSLEKVRPESPRHFFNLAALQVRRELIELARSLSGPMGMGKNLESVDGTATSPNDRPGKDRSCETHEASGLATWTEFHQAVGKLDDEERETFELIWYQGFNQETVAQLQDVSQKTVSRRWQKAKRSVYEILGKQLPE